MSSGALNIGGRCLCGAVSFTAQAKSSDVASCHCTMCQRQVAGPYMAIECTPGSLRVAGQENVAAYKSSEWAQREFCKVCGSALFWRSLDGRHEVVSAGALDGKDRLKFSMQMYVDEKPGYYDFANDTEKLTGAEFVAMISGGSNGD